MDSNPDGIDDFEGLTRRLRLPRRARRHLLVADAVPEAPRKDDGHDISDYFTVDPCVGTLGDFVQFTHEAQQRGIIDLVVSHTLDLGRGVHRIVMAPYGYGWYRRARGLEYILDRSPF